MCQVFFASIDSVDIEVNGRSNSEVLDLMRDSIADDLAFVRDLILNGYSLVNQSRSDSAEDSSITLVVACEFAEVSYIGLNIS